MRITQGRNPLSMFLNRLSRVTKNYINMPRDIKDLFSIPLEILFCKFRNSLPRRFWSGIKLDVTRKKQNTKFN